MDKHLLLFVFGFIAFTVSTIAGGGGALILVPLINFFVRNDVVAPLIHLGNFIGRPTRILIFRKHIRWDIAKAYLPMAIIGAVLGAWLFATLQLEWLQIFIGLFLISTIWQYRWGKRERSFAMRLKFFAPLGFLVCFLSSLIGATGAVLNPFYLNFGVGKEELVATKAANSFVVSLFQISTYAAFGLFTTEIVSLGLAIGLGAALGNFLGKRFLKRISDKRFRILVIAVMVISGILILVRQIPAIMG